MVHAGRYIKFSLGLILVLFFLGLVGISVASPATAVVYYVEVDKTVYEVGEPVFVNSSYFVEGSSYTLATFSIGFNSSTVGDSSFSDYGAVTRVVTFYLDPSDWNPGVNGTDGWAKVSVEVADLPSDTSGSPYASDSKNVFFTVVRAGQNCSLKYVYPNPPVDDSSVILTFRLFNEHNSSFPVVSNNVSFNVFSPNGSLILSNSTVTDLNGEFTVEFDPNSFSGNYTIEIHSFENEDYEAGLFTFIMEVSSGSSNFSKPTRIELEYDFIGSTVIRDGQEVSYALEPVKVFLKLFDDVLDSSISSGEVRAFVFDWRNVTVFNVTGVTNGSGVFEFNFSPPYSGSFSVYAEFLGNETFNPSNNTLVLPEFLPRPLKVEVVEKFPNVVYVGESYWVSFRVVDNFTGLSVSGVNVSLFSEWPMKFPLSDFKVTNESGYSEFQVEIPASYANVLPGYRHVAGWFMDTRDPVVYENSSVIWEQFFREASLTYVSVNCSEVLRKESVMVNVYVCSDDGVPLNGSVQLYWDNVELFNVSLFNGSSIFLLNISPNENVGFHVLNVTFNEINYDVSFYNVSIAVKSMFDTSINISSLDICRGESCSFEILVLDAFDQNPVPNVTVFAELNDNKIILEGVTDDNGSIFYLWHVPPGFQPGIYVVRFNLSKEFYNPLYLEFSVHVWIRTSITFNVSVSENVLTQKLLVKTVGTGNMKAKASQQYDFTSSLCCFLRRKSVDEQKTWKIIGTFSVKLQHIIKDEKLILLGRKKVRIHGKVKGFPSLRMF
ncbi:MAG: hypothetical protein ACTSYM_01185 [Candidatus Baldrarchaeia archaeon]